MQDGYLLIVERKRHGVTQSLLADALGVSRQTIGAWERKNELPEHKAMAYRNALSRLSGTSQ